MWSLNNESKKKFRVVLNQQNYLNKVPKLVKLPPFCSAFNWPIRWQNYTTLLNDCNQILVPFSNIHAITQVSFRFQTNEQKTPPKKPNKTQLKKIT